MNPPDWLGTFQALWSKILRTPLATHSGTFTAEPTELWMQIESGPGQEPSVGLAVYQRQYWLRLFNCLQSEFPLTAALMGYWNFNGLAQDFLVLNPPRSYALETIAVGFEAYLRSRALPGPPGCLLQAAAWDRARSQCFYAPRSQPWDFREGASPSLLIDMVLQPAEDWRLVREDWGLLDLFLNAYASALSKDPKPTLFWPARHRETQFFLVQRAREAKGLVYRPLLRAQAFLYEALPRQSLLGALEELEAAFGKSEAQLPEKVQRWMEESVSWGLWQRPR